EAPPEGGDGIPPPGGVELPPLLGGEGLPPPLGGDGIPPLLGEGMPPLGGGIGALTPPGACTVDLQAVITSAAAATISRSFIRLAVLGIALSSVMMCAFKCW
ncbi:MAG TPA: hypothetical protein PKK10_06335, partial [Woeseiaceae bacterium]|nr:hypothetical protein [Woeseiaceae bacterium]